jgi:hypothetical protein
LSHLWELERKGGFIVKIRESPLNCQIEDDDDRASEYNAFPSTIGVYFDNSAVINSSKFSTKTASNKFSWFIRWASGHAAGGAAGVP